MLTEKLVVLTALLSICGMDVITFIVAALLSLPRQIVGVYLGYALISAPDGSMSLLLLCMTSS
jgi:uncharacterized membrane protein YdjX (TVP38/TMEM64 family)